VIYYNPFSHYKNGTLSLPVKVSDERSEKSSYVTPGLLKVAVMLMFQYAELIRKQNPIFFVLDEKVTIYPTGLKT